MSGIGEFLSRCRTILCGGRDGSGLPGVALGDCGDCGLAGSFVLWLLISRFRKMCRTVRREIAPYLRETHPEFESRRASGQGKTCSLRHKDGAERIWEMADRLRLPSAGLPGMGADPARAQGNLLPAPVDRLLNPKPDRSQPAVDGDARRRDQACA